MLKRKTISRLLLGLVAGASSAQPGLAAEVHRDLQYEGARRAPFAGATFRLELGRRAGPAATRLQMGFRSVSHGRQPEAPVRMAHLPIVELGAAGRDRGNLFIAGQSTSQIERRLEMNGRIGKTAVVIGAVALLVVGVIVITNLDELDEADGN